MQRPSCFRSVCWCLCRMHLGGLPPFRSTRKVLPKYFSSSEFLLLLRAHVVLPTDFLLFIWQLRVVAISELSREADWLNASSRNLCAVSCYLGEPAQVMSQRKLPLLHFISLAKQRK